MTKDKPVRSIVKAFSWRLFATVITILIVYIATGEFAIAFGVGIIEVLSKLLLYYMHERVWVRIKWGKKNETEVKLT